MNCEGCEADGKQTPATIRLGDGLWLALIVGKIAKMIVNQFRKVINEAETN